jgi:hypothetical protein
MPDNHAKPECRLPRNPGSLNLLEPYGSVQDYIGIALTLYVQLKSEINTLGTTIRKRVPKICVEI